MKTNTYIAIAALFFAHFAALGAGVSAQEPELSEEFAPAEAIGLEGSGPEQESQEVIEPVTEERIFYRDGKESSREVIDANGQVIMQEQLNDGEVAEGITETEVELSESVIDQLFEEETTLLDEEGLVTSELDEETEEVAEEELQPAAPVKQGSSGFGWLTYVLVFMVLASGGVIYWFLSRKAKDKITPLETAPAAMASQGPAQVNNKSKLEEVIEDLGKSAK